MNSTERIKRILVAEDDPTISQLLNMQLIKQGYQVIHAPDGAIAWEMLNQDDLPDLVLLDILMPGLDGFEVCRRIRATSHLATLPVVMLTALQDASSRLEGIRAGANDFLSKPWNKAELQARIATLLKLKDVQDTLKQQHKQLELLYNISRELNTFLDLNQMLSSILSQSAQLCDAQRGSIILFADIGPMRKIQLCADRAEMGFEIYSDMNPADMSISNLLADSPKPLLIDDATLIIEFEQTPTRSLLATPFIHQGKLQGFMMLEHEQLNFFTNEHLMLFNSIAQQATVTIEKISLFEHVQEERQRFAALINSMNDAVIATGRDNKIILINPAGLKLLNVDKDSLIGCPVTEVLGIQPLAEPFQQVANEFTPVSQEFEWSNGRTLYATISPVGGGGQLAVIQDITNMKKLQAMQLAAEQEKTARVRATFERYMSPALVDRTLSEESGLMEKRERRMAAVLFADLRGFTRLTYRFPADDVIAILNEYFSVMTRIAYAHNGTIFDIVGDELMVGFGVPFDLPDPVTEAVRTGIEMQTVFGELAARWWKKYDDRRLGMGIGIDYGQVVVGNVGSATRMNYALVGSPVNTAHALVSTAADREIRFLEIIKSRLLALDNELTIQTITGVQLKGRDKPETIYNLLVDRPES
ncbi:MAG: response regulator [Anaerolineales bacterium]|nr:response regulator [Anaerolineales bacterium]